MMKCSKWAHWLGMVLWLLAVVALVLAWVAVRQKGLILGLEPLAWYWNALIFGVLSLGAGKCDTTCSVEPKV